MKLLSGGPKELCRRVVTNNPCSKKSLEIKQSNLMKRANLFFTIIVILLLELGLVGFSRAANETTVEKILANTDSYDEEEVLLSGTVSKLRFRTSQIGNDYTTFSLIGDSGESINVFIWGHSKIKEGRKVKVLGIYRKIKKMGRYTFYNEIEAIEVK